MRFIDWDGNGKIDPTDIGISVAMESNEDDVNDIPPPIPKNITKHGCLTSVLSFVGVALFVILIAFR